MFNDSKSLGTSLAFLFANEANWLHRKSGRSKKGGPSTTARSVYSGGDLPPLIQTARQSTGRLFFELESSRTDIGMVVRRNEGAPPETVCWSEAGHSRFGRTARSLASSLLDTRASELRCPAARRGLCLRPAHSLRQSPLRAAATLRGSGSGALGPFGSAGVYEKRPDQRDK